MAEQKAVKPFWKTKTFLVGAVISVGILLFALAPALTGMFAEVTKKPISDGDFSIGNLKYEPYSGWGSAIYYDDETRRIRAQASLIITTERDDLFVLLYDKIHDKSIRDWTQNLRRGDNKIDIITLYLDSISQKPELEICFGTEYGFNKYSKGVLCKVKTFNSPNIDFSISPDPVYFTVDKSVFGEQDTKTITVKNIGDTPVDISIVTPNYQQMHDYPSWTNPQFWLKGDIYASGVIYPQESKTYQIAASASDSPNLMYDTSTGQYTATGYVWIRGGYSGTGYNLEDAIYKKPFSLIATVVKKGA